MKALKFILAAIALVFAGLGLGGVLSYDVASPVMFVFLALTLFSVAKERYDLGNKRDTGLYCLLAAVILFDVISGLITGLAGT